MVRITERLQTPAKTDTTLTLSFEQRQKSRQRVRLDSGEDAGLSLPHGTMLRAGDRLRAKDGRVVEVRALAEPVTTGYSVDPHLLARAAYHLGNRHIALEIGAGWVRYRDGSCIGRDDRLARVTTGPGRRDRLRSGFDVRPEGGRCAYICSGGP